MKISKKKLAVIVCSLLVVFATAFAVLFSLSSTHGEFRLSKNKAAIEYYYFDKIRANSAKVKKNNNEYTVKNGRVTKINGKNSGVITARDKKKYYVVNGKTFSGIYNDYLYNNGIINKKANGLITVDNKEYCFKNGELYSGLFDKVYYTNGLIDESKTGFFEFDGNNYYFEKGRLFNGLHENEYYKDGLIESGKTGYFDVNGQKLYFDKGSLFTGILENKYFEKGLFNGTKTGIVKYNNADYYVENGLLYSGFTNNAMYKNGVPDKEYNGFKIIDNIEYYFTEGVITDIPNDVPVKILLVGNSYTYYNGLGQMLCKFIYNTGKAAIVVRATKGGYTLPSLMHKKIAYCAWRDGKEIAQGENNLPAIAQTDYGKQDRAGRWDYILCQNNDKLSKIKNDNISFFNEYIKCVSDSSRILFHATYYSNSTPSDRLNIIKEAADECKCTVVNSVSYYAAYNSNFNRSWQSDLTIGDNPKHPASKGAYLMALCIYAKIFGTDALAKSQNDSNYIKVYNSDNGNTSEFAPNKYKKKKMTKSYAMKVTKSEAIAFQAFVSKYAETYLGDSLIGNNEKTEE